MVFHSLKLNSALEVGMEDQPQRAAELPLGQRPSDRFQALPSGVVVAGHQPVFFMKLEVAELQCEYIGAAKLRLGRRPRSGESLRYR